MRGSSYCCNTQKKKDRRVCPPRPFTYTSFSITFRGGGGVVGACKWRHLCAPPDWSIISLFSQSYFDHKVSDSLLSSNSTQQTKSLFFFQVFSHHPHRATYNPYRKKNSLSSCFHPIFNPFGTALEEAVRDGREMRKFYHPGRGVMTTYRTQQDAAFSVTKFLEDGRPILTIEKQKNRREREREAYY